MTVTQTQKPDAIVPAVFRLPLDVSVKMTAGYEKKSIDIHQRIEKFSVKMRAKPQSIEFDPDGKVLAMNVKILPIPIRQIVIRISTKKSPVNRLTGLFL
ncbi:MAG: hypothetical protein IPP63_15720 [Chloracidobacterium sp.]|nr:hypothetical protein [Chloracidobacterium sp.]